MFRVLSNTTVYIQTLVLHTTLISIGAHKFDELDALRRRNLDLNLQGTLLQACGIISIAILPVPGPSWLIYSYVARPFTKPSLKHKFMIRLGVKSTMTVEEVFG